MFINLLGYGDAETSSAWIKTVNDIPTTHLNRLYYCLNSHAYYEIDGKLHRFIENNLYILPQNINIKFFRYDDAPPFSHIYFDFIIRNKVYCVTQPNSSIFIHKYRFYYTSIVKLIQESFAFECETLLWE